MTNIPNADGRDFWSGPSGLSWIASQEELDTIMADVASAVMETAAPNAGDKVIDIGCGTGALSLLAANAVGVLARAVVPEAVALQVDAVLAHSHAVHRAGVVRLAGAPGLEVDVRAVGPCEGALGL